MLISTAPDSKLVRTIGRWSLTALTLNVVIGSGIFGLPAIITHLLGPLGPWAYLVAAAGVGVITACFAEVGSQFPEAGGPYLYTRVAYGQFAGIQVAWLALLVRLTSGAASANIFVEYLGGFLPATQGRLGRVLVLTLLIGGIAAINIAGVKAGANLSSLFAAAKILPLCIFIVAGLALLGSRTVALGSVAGTPGPGPKEWLSAILLVVFALSGFEAALFPMGEARDTRHDAPFALFSSLIICVTLYTLIQVVVLRALGLDPTGARPLADAARVFLGRGGARLMEAGAMLSVYGHLSSLILNSPRLPFALAERGDFPSVFGAVSQKFRTPYVAIISFTLVMFALALLGTFRANAVLSAVARLFTYGAVCASVITLRRRQPNADAFRLPAGPLVSILGLVFVLALVTQMGIRELIAVASTMAVALLNWMWARRGEASYGAVRN
jgi:amino acid transporter